MPDIQWQKSSFSMENGNNDCIELARCTEAVLIRESDDPGVISGATPARARALLHAVKRGAFEDVGTSA